jgi:hypothetical protein
MIELHYSGGLGNNLWQYTSSRIFAEKHGLMLLSKPIRNFPSTLPIVPGKIHLMRKKKITGHFLPEFEIGHKYVFKGQFERFEHFIGHELQVKTWATPRVTTFDKPESGDLVVSIRRGWNKWPAETLCPSIDYYVKLLSNFSFKKLFICTDSPNDEYFLELNKYVDFKIYRESPINQFNFIMNAKRYIMAPSTFSFWASYVGHGSEIFWPNIWALDNEETNYDWFPVTDSRYIKINV